MKYVEMFLRLRCSSDVLGLLSPIGSGYCKEISEAMTLREKIRKLTLDNPMKYNIVELCAGNPISSALSLFSLPVSRAVAVDKRIVRRKYARIRRFEYIEKNIYDDDIIDLIDENTIIMASHPCKNLAIRIIEIYKNSKSPFLIIMPCCVGDVSDEFKKKYSNSIFRLDKYKTWCRYLQYLTNGRPYELMRDRNCLSPVNCIVSDNLFEEENMIYDEIEDDYEE
jgi:hypothetical protein